MTPPVSSSLVKESGSAGGAGPGEGRALGPRILLVDDSMVIRTLVSSWIEAEPDLELAGVAAEGAEAVKILAREPVDICILDLEMPVMGGLETIPKLLRIRPELKILVASRLAQDGAVTTLRALDAGAADCICKPSAREPGSVDTFKRELLAKVRGLGQARPAVARRLSDGRTGRASMRPMPGRVDVTEVVVVAASTGGPPALRQFLEGLPSGFRAPVVIVQHMPAAFIELLAVQLSKGSPLPVCVAAEGMLLEPGRAYLAPGDHHLRVVRNAGRLAAEIDEGPPENFCRPAADVLFRSAAKTCGPRTVGVVLTGMGRDGWAGSSIIADRGGLILAQDESTSVVWGMPGAVVEAGLASLVGHARRLAAAAQSLSLGEAP